MSRVIKIRRPTVKTVDSDELSIVTTNSSELAVLPESKHLTIEHQGKKYQAYEVIGRIVSIVQSKNNSPTICNVFWLEKNRSYPVNCNFFCPARDGDTFNGICIINNDMLYPIKQPWIQPPIDSSNTITAIIKATYKRYNTARKIYNEILNNAGSEAEVVTYLSDLAQRWNSTRNNSILGLINENPKTVRKLLDWWYNNRNLRRLYLFGLSKKEINAARKTCEEIFNICAENPYTIPSIPLDKCDNIMSIFRKTPTAEQRYRGLILRTIWKNLTVCSWTATPLRFLRKQYLDFDSHIPDLEKDYNIVIDYDCAYLRYPHEVESSIADFVVKLKSMDNLKYDNEIDFAPCSKLINQNIELSDAQKKAVQGALDHRIVSITGGPGSGKCLAPNTKLLLASGKPIKAKDVQLGDKLMGYNNTVRNVLSVTQGRDLMYRIIPENGIPFECNAPHILTLKGMTPYMVENTVHYSERGIIKSLTFEDRTKGEYFLHTLEDDIFDIPLNIYLKRYNGVHHKVSLIRQPLLLPAEKIPIDPIMIASKLSFLDSIPEIYIYNHKNVRLCLLQGIIHHYAHTLNNNNVLVISELKPRVMEDLQFIVFSLGCSAKIENGQLIISLENHFTTAFTVKELDEGKYYGFTLDGDGRFLLSDCIVTHNTTVLTEIIHNFELRGICYALCSFTGKAVARIREVIQKDNPSTIHRLISNCKKNKIDERSHYYEQEESRKYVSVNIDEASMVTTELLHDLLYNFPSVEKILLVGDINQLPPIQWGSFFHQLIISETIPVYYLTTTFRVKNTDGQTNGIVTNLNAMISHDNRYPFEFYETDNFTIIEGTQERVYDILIALYENGVPAKDVVVLCPYNRYLPDLNKEIQSIYDEGSRSVTDTRGITWRIGDRVMMIENDKEISVFNGETGEIIDIINSAILVKFGNSSYDFLLEPQINKEWYGKPEVKQYNYRKQVIDEVLDGDEGETSSIRSVLKLTHAYAMTIDKAQGSEWQYVILYIPIFTGGSFLNMNRIYTGLSRAKVAVWSVVSDIYSYNACATKPLAYRCENLAKRLKERLEHFPPYKPIDNTNVGIKTDIYMLEDVPEDYFDNGIDYDDY